MLLERGWTATGTANVYVLSLLLFVLIVHNVVGSQGFTLPFTESGKTLVMISDALSSSRVKYTPTGCYDFHLWQVQNGSFNRSRIRNQEWIDSDSDEVCRKFEGCWSLLQGNWSNHLTNDEKINSLKKLLTLNTVQLSHFYLFETLIYWQNKKWCCCKKEEFPSHAWNQHDPANAGFCGWRVLSAPHKRGTLRALHLGRPLPQHKFFSCAFVDLSNSVQFYERYDIQL